MNDPGHVIYGCPVFLTVGQMFRPYLCLIIRGGAQLHADPLLTDSRYPIPVSYRGRRRQLVYWPPGHQPCGGSGAAIRFLRRHTVRRPGLLDRHPRRTGVPGSCFHLDFFLLLWYTFANCGPVPLHWTGPAGSSQSIQNPQIFQIGAIPL